MFTLKPPSNRKPTKVEVHRCRYCRVHRPLKTTCGSTVVGGEMGVEEKYMKVVQDREAMLQFAACLQIFFF